MYIYFKTIAVVGGGNYIYSWKSKRLSYENITPTTTTDYSLTPKLNYFGTTTRVEVSGSCLKQDKIIFNHGKIVNIYIFYEINKNYDINSYPTLTNCLFEEVILTKNADIDKYKYCRHEIGFDIKWELSFGNFHWSW